MDRQRLSREDYLSYVRTLYERAQHDQARRGYTSWALLIGLVYVVWNSLPIIDRAREVEHLIFDVTLAYANIHIIGLSSLFLLGLAASSRPGITAFDYRFRPFTGDSIGSWGLIYFLVFALPAIASYLAVLSLPESDTPLIKKQLLSNGFLLASLAVLLIGILLIQVIYRRKTGYPFALADLTVMHPSRGSSIALALIAILVIELLVGNVYVLVLHSRSLEKLSDILILAFNAVLLVMGMVVFLVNIFNDVRLNALTRLERDIILHEIDDGQIRKRLEEEYLGRQIGAWLTDRIEHVQRAGDRCIDHAKSCDQLVADIGKLDQSLKYEILGRVEAYADKLKHLNDQYVSAIEPLLDWLNLASRASAVAADSYLQEVLIKYREDLRHIHKNVGDLVKKAADSIETIAKKDVMEQTG